MYNIDDFAKHVWLAGVSFSEERLGYALRQVLIEPNLDFSLLIHTNEILLHLKVPNTVVELSKSPEGLVVHMQDVGVGDVVNVAQSMVDVLEEEVGFVEGWAHIVLGFLFQIDRGHQRIAIIAEVKGVPFKIVLAPIT